MIVYRITHLKWAGMLTPSGMPARWNSKGKFMLYTAESRALACLENLVHRRSIGPDELYRVTTIDIPKEVSIATLSTADLPTNWQEYTQYASCQTIGDAWLSASQSAVLKVPSAIIPEEHNYVINVLHPDMKFIQVKRVEPFSFDFRLITNH